MNKEILFKLKKPDGTVIEGGIKGRCGASITPEEFERFRDGLIEMGYELQEYSLVSVQ